MAELNKRVELIGKRFGKLIIVGPGEITGGCHRTFWLCKCDCGNEKSIREANLLLGMATSCGCLKGQRVKTNKPELAALYDKWNKATVWRVYQYKHAALQRGYCWELTPFDCEELMQQNCHYCDEPPSNVATMPKRAKPTGYRDGEFKYSGLDRVDNAIGYTRTNVVPCCKICNLAKHAMSKDLFLSWLTRAYRHSIESKHVNPQVLV